jgi:hypothetical protein
MAFVIDTERLSLRLRTKADAVCNLGLLREHEGGTTMSIDEVEQRLVEQNERAQWEGFGLLSIRPRDEMRPIGYCGLNVRRCSSSNRNPRMRSFPNSGAMATRRRPLVP